MNYGRQAELLVLGDRQQSYGPPKDDYSKTAKMWSGLLFHKLLPGIEITPKEAILMMVALKLSREVNRAKPDNLIDAHGYLHCAAWVELGEKPEVDNNHGQQAVGK